MLHLKSAAHAGKDRKVGSKAANFWCVSSKLVQEKERPRLDMSQVAGPAKVPGDP